MSGLCRLLTVFCLCFGAILHFIIAQIVTIISTLRHTVFCYEKGNSTEIQEYLHLNTILSRMMIVYIECQVSKANKK